MINESMEKLRKGDIEALNNIYEETRKLVFSICLSYVHDQMLAEDMMQDTYMKVRANINMYQEGTNANAWICTIAKNLCLNEIKSRSRNTYVENVFESNNESVEYKETPLLNIAKKILKDKELEILLRHIINEEKLIDIACNLKMSEGTVRWSYNNSLTKIKKYIERNDINEKR